ncbi:MAG TPA: uroporphyrinogen-III C-methyltransferase [Pirellulaceae bacterium]|nr:uroporphyrinogen-III C-methyltransferase [Pirellulaceae bacterium]
MSPLQPARTRSPGRVILVGAGPGSPDLITLRGVEALRCADVVLYDYLANPLLLEHCRADAERICLGRHGSERVWDQDRINRALVEEASRGRIVVRLKGGDPSIFGCAAQELAALIGAEIPFEVVPGVTAASAAAADAGIPITHREHASAVAFVTGREDRGKSTSSLDYAALAQFPGTLLLYMGTTTVESWSTALIAAGKPAETPVAIVRRASHPDAEVITTTLAEVAQVVRTPRPIRPPVIFVIGPVAALSERLVAPCRTEPEEAGSASSRSLIGRTVWVTRPEEQARDLIDSLRQLGARVLARPAIRCVPAPVGDTATRLLDEPCRFDWVVFNSANGVLAWFAGLERSGRDARWFATAKIATVGRGTAEALRRFGLIADLVPDRFDAERLAETLIEAEHGSLGGSRRALLIRGEQGRATLRERLSAAGWTVDESIAYRTEAVAEFGPDIVAPLDAGRIDWTTVTSPSIASSIAHLGVERLSRTRLVAISPLTAEALERHGLPVAAIASEASDEGLIAAMLDATARDAIADDASLDDRAPDGSAAGAPSTQR